MTRQPDLDAVELISVRVSADGTGLRLVVKDSSGRSSVVALPVNWLSAMLTAVPHPPCGGTVLPLDSWSMDRTGNGKDLLLTLRTPDGHSVSFAMKPWQIEGMATLATYGNAAGAGKDTVH